MYYKFSANKTLESIPYNQSTYISIIYMRKGILWNQSVQAKRVLAQRNEPNSRESRNEKASAIAIKLRFKTWA